MKHLIFSSIFLLLCLSSCGTGNSKHPRVISSTTSSLIVDYAGAGDLLQATKEAQKCCKKLGKDAQYVRTEEEKSSSGTVKKMAFFNCKD